MLAACLFAMGKAEVAERTEQRTRAIVAKREVVKTIVCKGGCVARDEERDKFSQTFILCR